MGPELSISAGSQQVTLMLLVHHPHLSSEAPFCKKRKSFLKVTFASLSRPSALEEKSGLAEQSVTLPGSAIDNHTRRGCLNAQDGP